MNSRDKSNTTEFETALEQINNETVFSDTREKLTFTFLFIKSHVYKTYPKQRITFMAFAFDLLQDFYRSICAQEEASLLLDYLPTSNFSENRLEQAVTNFFENLSKKNLNNITYENYSLENILNPNHRPWFSNPFSFLKPKKQQIEDQNSLNTSLLNPSSS